MSEVESNCSATFSQVGSAVNSEQRRILVVDDEAYNLFAITSLLELLKDYPGLVHITDTASSGESALRKATKNLAEGVRYCLIIVDLSMQPMDGFQVVENIRELYEEEEQPKIVVCSGHVDSLYLERAWHTDVDEFCSKPLALNVL